MTLLKAAIEIGKIAFRYGKSAGKFTSGETTFVTRFPPPYRPYIRDVLKGAQTVFTGGLIADIIQNELNTGSTESTGGKIPERNGTKANKFRQKHFRRNFHNGSRRYKYGTRCVNLRKRLHRKCC